MGSLAEILERNRDDLVYRVRALARDSGYLDTISPTLEQWTGWITRVSDLLCRPDSITGLNLLQGRFDRLCDDPSVTSMVREVRSYRKQGASLTTVLGILKLFRKVYLDFFARPDMPYGVLAPSSELILSLFDRLELAFCADSSFCVPVSSRFDAQPLAANGESDFPRFTMLLESLRTPVVLLDRSLVIEYCNQTAWLMFGGADTRGGLRGKPIAEVAPQIAVAIAALDHAQVDEATVERRIETLLGVRHMDVRISRSRSRNGEIEGIGVVLNDVTLRHDVEERLRGARKDLEVSVRERTDELELTNERLLQEVKERQAAEQVLRESEARYRSLVDLSPDGIIVHSEGVVVFANAAALRMCGADSDQLVLGRSVLDFVHPDDFQRVAERVRRMVATGGREPAIAERFLRTDGVAFEVEVTASGVVYKGKPSVQVVFRNIEERVRQEAEAEERRRAVEILLKAQDQIPRVDPIATGPMVVDAMARSCNAYGAEWYVMEDNGLLRLDANAGFSNAGRRQSAETLRRPVSDGGVLTTVASSREPVYVPDCASDPLWLARDGDFRSAFVVPVRFGERLFGVVLLMSMDPDGFSLPRRTLATLAADYLAAALESVRLNAQTREAEARFRSIFENAVEGIYQCMPDGRVVVANPALARMLGFKDPSDLLMSPNDFLDRLHSDPARRQAFLAELSMVGEVRGFEYEARRADGGPVWVSESARAVRDDAGSLLYWEGVIEDVSRRRDLEGQLLHAQKMEAVGRLAGGVAHDFNNLLTAILGYSGLVMERLGPNDPAWHDVVEIRDAGKRAAALTGQLLAFSRKQVLKPMVVDLNEVVSSIEKLLRRLIGEDIDLRTSLCPEQLWVRVDPGQLDQVIVNLALNSRDAMSGGGRLSITATTLDVIDPDRAASMAIDMGKYALLEVEDTGTGMDAETKGHLFEPFFSTKGPGMGTGLGLAVVFGIVKQSGGTIWFKSEPGAGTRMSVCLPRLDGSPEELASPEALMQPARGVETVLVAEDESSVRGLVRVILEGAGYRVIEAREGLDALRIASEYDGPVHLLLTDVIMPGMNGRDLARILRDSRPGIRVLFTSGYTDFAVEQAGFVAEGTLFLQKPFSPIALLEMVRGLLDSPAKQA